jgi:hypothetical protein
VAHIGCTSVLKEHAASDRLPPVRARLQRKQQRRQLLVGRVERDSALRAISLRRAELQDSFLSAIRSRPHAHQLNPNASAQGLTNEPRAAATELRANATRDVDRPSEVVLRAVHCTLEVQQVAARCRGDGAPAMPRPQCCRHVAHS